MSNALRVCRASLRTAQGPGPLGFEAEDSGAVGALKIAGLIRCVCLFCPQAGEQQTSTFEGGGVWP